MESLQRKSRTSHSQGIIRHCPSVWCKSFRFMRSLENFQVADCKQFSVDAGLGPFLGNFPACHVRVTTHLYGNISKQFVCTFQTMCSDSAKEGSRQILAAMVNLSGIPCESWSQLSTFKHSSDNISPSGLLWGNS